MSIIADAFVSELLDGLATLVKDEVSMLLGVTNEIKRLQQKIQTINAYLADAESKKIQSKVIGDWLKKLKDVMYDADDILDECRIEAEKSKAAVSSGGQHRSFWTSVCGHCRLFSCSCFRKTAFAHQIGRRIQDLNSNLEDILAEKSKFGLQISSAGRDDHRSTPPVSRKTSPLTEPDIIGSNIEKDTNKLVELLIKEDTQENILVYAIVGVGGIGKTALAQRIFNDARIAANFPQMKRWVCVSKDYEETSLLKEIIDDQPGGDYTRAQLETKVQNIVTNKKFLLVLDDVWDPKVWNDFLRIPLHGGATGSRVLVTTRKEGVALQMKAIESHQVELLSAEDGWALICKKVVLSGEEGDIDHLKDIGKKIVEKCGRLPLAITTIGGVLLEKRRNDEDWEKVLKTLSNNTWTALPEGVQPALYLSYEDLPSHLKQCFLYCSLFPEDYKFNRRELIRLWISEGFIHEEGDLTMEELGEDYYGDLVQRSFLQHDSLCVDIDDYSILSKVHDLLWSLARFLAKEENLFVKDGVPKGSSSVKPRRLGGSVTEEKRQAFIDALEGHNSFENSTITVGRIPGGRECQQSD